MGEDFKSKYTLEERIFESGKLKFKYPDRIPIVIKPNKSTSQHKYLVPRNINVGEFVNIIRRRIKLDSQKAIFLLVNNILPPTAHSISSIYDEHKDEDGFLYVVYSLENTFG